MYKSKLLAKSTFQLLRSNANIIPGSFRSIYSVESLGIDGYKVAREKVKAQFSNSSDKFRVKMVEFMEDKPTNMIFTEDLKNMVHLVEDRREDIELLIAMLKKFNSQNKELRFGNFVFGPVVMRMFHFLEQDEAALQAFKDPQLSGFFDQLSSFQILMDLLYKKTRYQDVLDVFNLIKERQIQGGKYPKHVVVLTFAACYKLNTPEAFDNATKLWKELNSVGHMAMRKAATFAAGLALRQKAPHIAVEILSTIREQHYLTVRNLKAYALAEMGRPDDALPILRSILEIDDPVNKKRTFVREVVDKVKESIETHHNKAILTDFQRIEKFFNDHGNITDQTLEDILCTEITSTSASFQRRDKNFIAASFGRENYSGKRDNFNRNRRQREGLVDLI